MNTSEMEDIHDIRPPIDGDTWVLVATGIAILIALLMICVYILRFLYSIYVKYSQSKKPAKTYVAPEPKIDYKGISIQRLNDLISRVENNNQDLHFAYVELSEIIRWFIEGTYKNKALKKTKSELEYLKMEKLNEILNKCYGVEFAKEEANKETLLEKSKSAINIILQWA